MNELTTSPMPAAATSFPSLTLIDPDALTISVKVAEPRKKYWFGTLPGSPYQNTSFGGVSFNRYEDRPRIDAAGNKSRVAKYGEVKELTADQANRVLADLALSIIRFTGDASRNEKVTARLLVRDATYVPEHEDKTFAEFAYFVELPAVLSDNWRDHLPISVAEATRQWAASPEGKKAIEAMKKAKEEAALKAKADEAAKLAEATKAQQAEKKKAS